jgi:hypothetical protein
MLSIAGFSFKAQPRSVVNQLTMPPAIGQPSGLQCTIGFTSLPQSTIIYIPSLFITLSNVRRLAICSTCHERGSNETTMLYN